MACAKTAASRLDMFAVVVFQSCLQTNSLVKYIDIPFPWRKQMKCNHNPVDEKEKLHFRLAFFKFSLLITCFILPSQILYLLLIHTSGNYT